MALRFFCGCAREILIFEHVHRTDQNVIMQKIALYSLTLLLLPACHPKPVQETAHTDTLSGRDSSLIAPAPPDTAPAALAPARDTPVITEQQLLGKWTRPVQGKEDETEGFELKKKGNIRSLNATHFSTVYDKWELKKDTLILRSHQQSGKEPLVTIDTALITGISDSSLVLFPIRAAAGYEERYVRSGYRK